MNKGLTKEEFFDKWKDYANTNQFWIHNQDGIIGYFSNINIIWDSLSGFITGKFLHHGKILSYMPVNGAPSFELNKFRHDLSDKVDHA